MDLKVQLSNLEDSIDEHNVYIHGEDGSAVALRLAYYELGGYSTFFKQLEKDRSSCSSYAGKELLLESYKKIYASERKMYGRILRNLVNGSVTITWPENLDDNMIRSFLVHFGQWDASKSLHENIENRLKKTLRQRIYEINQELFALKHHPSVYINTSSTYIGPAAVCKYENQMIVYKDVNIAVTGFHHFSVLYNENSSENSINTILSILAYLNGRPSFYFTENADFNRKISELYLQFDLLDMLRLRKKNFFRSSQDEPISLELPILKNSSQYNIVCLADSQHEMIFELYHASLKQFEPLPRCVFLYRVFEYGAYHHYQPLVRPANYSHEDAIEYYVQQIMTHRFNPLLFVDYGTYQDEHGAVVRKRNPKYVNFTSKLKEEVKKIKKEWSNHPYLRNKRIGNIIYGTGRNAAAHGGGGRLNARYDYSANYKHINDVNVFLELIARYIIEQLHPQLTNIVERKIQSYIAYNNYEKLFNKP